MSHELNVYYHPEKHGLEVVAEIDYSSGRYEFDMRVVWRHKPTGTLYTGRDAGCSCPSPFEDYSDLAALEVVNLATLEQEAREHRSARYGVYRSLAECEAFLSSVRTAMG